MSFMWMDQTQRDDVVRLTDDEWCEKYQPSGSVIGIALFALSLMVVIGAMYLLNGR